MKRPILTALLALLHGELSASGLWYVGILILILALGAAKRYYSGCVLYAVFFVLGMGGMISAEAQRDMAEAVPDGTLIRIEGQVEEVRDEKYGAGLIIDAENVRSADGEVQGGGFRCMVRINEEVSGAVTGSAMELTGCSIRITGRKEPFDTPANPGGFDEKQYYYLRNIILGMKAENLRTAELQVTGVCRNEFRAAAYRVRKRLNDMLSEICPDREAGIFMAMLYGEKAYLDDDVGDIYRAGGISHILAISGLHISIVGMGMYTALRRVLPLRAAGAAGSVCMVMYVMLTGGSVSSLRAAIMFFIWLAAKLLGREYDIKSALSAAGLCLLADNPYYIYDTGFQLSFAAVAGTAFIAPYIMSFLDMRRKGGALTACISIGLATGPIAANTYYEASFYSVAVNMLVLPFMSAAVLSGIAGIAVGFLSVDIGSAVIYIGVLILRFYELLCRMVSELPFSHIVTGHFDTAGIIAYYGALAAAVYGVRLYLGGGAEWKMIYRYMLAAAAVILFYGGLYITFPKKEIITFLDVGQGDAAVLVSGNGTVCLFDAGSSSESGIGRYTLLPFLKYSGIKHVDYVILSHSDDDHINGIDALLEDSAVSVGAIVIPEGDGGFDDSGLAAEAANRGIDVVRADDSVSIADESMMIDIVSPMKKYMGCYSDVNDGSLGAVVTINGKNIFMTGDMGSSAEKKLIEEGKLKKVDVLKVAHHGSKYSSCSELLDILRPDIAVISCGRSNTYGHPHTETCSRLSRVCGYMAVTYETGAVTVYLDNSGGLTYDCYMSSECLQD